MTVLALDLCAGAGGLSLGLQRAGFEVYGVELDEDACATHIANVGPCERTSIVGWRPGHRFDLVAGGVPCQPFSEAGKREGTTREDGRLYEELIRIGVEADARALLLENVEGIMSWRDDDGWTAVGRIEQAMQAAGYESRRQILCAADYGVPQLRYRLFIVAFRDTSALSTWRWPAPTHASPDTCRLLGLKPWVTMREALGLGGGSFAAGRREGAKGWQGERFHDVDAPSYTIGTKNNADKLLPLDRPAPTILANKHDGAVDPNRASRRPLAEIQARLKRRLTLEELAILQGFPPGFAFHGATAGSRHRQVGNAVPPPLAGALGASLRLASLSSTPSSTPAPSGSPSSWSKPPQSNPNPEASREL